MPSANVVQTSVSGGQQNALALQGDGVFLPKLSTATRTALTLGTSDKGFLAYDTTDNNVYIWNGAAWESIPASGDSSNTQVIFNDNGILAGDAGLTYDKATDALTVGGNLTLSAGTALGVGYLNASKVLTAGPSLLFDGTNLGIAGTGQLRFATSGGAIGDNYIGTENSFSMKLHCGRGSTSSIELASDKLLFYTSAAERMRIDAAGQVGIGVTPSAWGSTYRALQIGLGTSLTGITNDVDINLVNNARFDGTNWKYTNTSPAERYRTAVGTHFWYNAASGTAGNNITWAQAMTLDASGRLIINSSTFIPPTLNTNGELNFIATSNTNVRFSYRGTDGVTRTANITLA